MEDNPGGTPNPLNPGQGPAPGPKEGASPIPRTTSSMPPLSQARKPEPVVAPEPATPEPTDTPEPTAPAPEAMPTIESVEVAPDPLARPMEQAPETTPQPVKKKKTGLIIGAIVCLFIAITCGVTAALLLLTPKEDPVIAAFDKLITMESMPNLNIKGDVNLEISNTEIPYSNVNLAFNSSIVANSRINSTDASLNVSLRNADDQISVDFAEMYTGGGDLFLKVDGLTDAIKIFLANQGVPDIKEMELETTPEETIEQPNSDELYASMIPGETADMIEKIDGVWIQISSDFLSRHSSTITDNESAACMANILNSFSSERNTIAKAYQDNPFVTSTTENLSVTSKKNPIYRLGFDKEAFTKFTDSLANSKTMGQLANCLKIDVETTKIEFNSEIFDQLPDIYVEINDSHDFTRVLFVKDLKDVAVTTDLELSYPNTINITEPEEYQEAAELLPDIFGEYEEINFIEDETFRKIIKE